MHHYYGGLRAFFNWVVREGFLSDSPITKVKVAKPRRKVIQPYTSEQIKAMLGVCDWDYQHNAKFLGSRNRAILLMLLDSGLRLSELANIRFQDIDTEQGWIKATGKGAKERVVRIGGTAQKALWRYLMHRPNNGRQEIWLSEEGRPLQGSGIQSMINRLKKRAGVADRGCVHRFRHTFALNFLRADRNPFNLQYLLGHSSLEMVRHYTATLGMEDALEAHKRASPADLMGLK
jgi:site-specific recombinase XerD